MSIDLHCPQCQKLIRAPDNAGGRRGKCPYCGGSVYIPEQIPDEEEIGLAPIDASEEARERELRRESSQYAAAVGHGVGSEVADGDDAAPGPLDYSADVEAFIIAMRDSQLEEADAVADRLKGSAGEARKHIEKMMADGDLPVMPDVPPPVVQGFVKTLLGRLK